MCIKILHCVVDEKFIDGAIELFDSIEGYKNEYVIIDSQNKNLFYCNNPQSNHLNQYRVQMTMQQLI